MLNDVTVKFLIAQMILLICMKVFRASKTLHKIGIEYLPYQLAFTLDFIISILIIATCDKTVIAILTFIRIAIVGASKYFYDKRSETMFNVGMVITLISLIYQFLR